MFIGSEPNPKSGGLTRAYAMQHVDMRLADKRAAEEHVTLGTAAMREMRERRRLGLI